MSSIPDDFSASSVDRRKVLLGLLFGSAAAVAAWRQPSKHLDYLGPDKLEDIIPTRARDLRRGTVRG